MRAVSLAGVRLLSDRQPGRCGWTATLRPAASIWLHYDGTPIAWIIVDIGPRDWSKLAYQFGHELGHVLANSWGPDAKPRTRASGWRRRWSSRSRSAGWACWRQLGAGSAVSGERRLAGRSGRIGDVLAGIGRSRRSGRGSRTGGVVPGASVGGETEAGYPGRAGRRSRRWWRNWRPGPTVRTWGR